MGTNGKKLTPRETIVAHEYSVEYLMNNVDKDTVVLTHHTPLIGLSDPQFKKSPIRGGFESDLMDLVSKTQPKYWLYGHTHYNKGITTIENTILLSNQLGYTELGEEIGYNPKMMICL